MWLKTWKCVKESYFRRLDCGVRFRKKHLSIEYMDRCLHVLALKEMSVENLAQNVFTIIRRWWF